MWRAFSGETDLVRVSMDLEWTFMNWIFGRFVPKQPIAVYTPWCITSSEVKEKLGQAE